MSEHPDIESLSAYHDGEAPELAEHVAGCAACAADLARLASVTGAVAAPVAALDNAAVDRMISQATASGVEEGVGEAVPAIPRPVPVVGRRRGWAILASAAAAVVVAGGLVGFLTRSEADRTTVSESASRPAADAANRQLQAPPAAVGAGISGDSPIDGGHLGEVANDRVLAAKVDPTIGNKGTSAAADVPATDAPTEAGGAPQPRTVGTRACEPEARSLDPAAGALVYVADAEHDGAPAKVLGFGPTGGRPITLFLLAQDGCRLLAKATLP
ncbi:MAG TPA: hypothetical protein VM121_03530 [Acidimicrobiales bacterium]|nr:hypothetical protein [Acidimicrobiales bacterium]